VAQRHRFRSLRHISLVQVLSMMSRIPLHDPMPDSRKQQLSRIPDLTEPPITEDRQRNVVRFVRTHFLELNEALREMNGKIVRMAFRHFTVCSAEKNRYGDAGWQDRRQPRDSQLDHL
jgi:hypothetical protein